VTVYVTLLVDRVADTSGADAPLSLAQAIALPLAMALVPLAIAAAVLRYRLWDIDIVIRKTLVYAPLTAIMAGVFTASMGLTHQLGARWNGRPYDERDHALLRARADAVARIIWLARRDAAGTSARDAAPAAPPASADAG
jgi:hypothetical protein